MSEIWETYPLAALVTKVGSGSTPKGGSEAYKAVGTPLIRSMNVVFFGFKKAGLAYIDEAQAAQLDNATVKAGDVLLNITGASIGRVTLAPAEFEGARVNQHVCIIRPSEALDARFLNAYLSSPVIQNQIWNDNFGVTRQALTKQQILDFQVPVPPKAEQTRIATQLDTLLTRIQSCNDRFDAIPALLKRFRQAVTNAACSGALSAEWRGTAYLKDWKLQTLVDVCDSITDGDHQAPPQSNSGVPFITISAMNEGKLRLEKASRFVPQGYFDGLKPSRKPARGDLLFSVTGSIGIPAQVNTDEPFTFQRHIAILKPQKSLVLSPFIALALNTESMRSQVMEVATGTAQLTIPLSGIRKFVVNLPPIAEQTEIVRRVEALFALADRIEARATAARTQAQRLSSLVLAKAFRGELVQQDPQDEPASVLLQRLAATQPAKAKASRGRPRTNTQELFATPEGVQPDAAGLPDGVWAAPEAVDEHAVTAMLVAVLKAWGGPMPQMQARIAAVLCLQPRQMTVVLPTEQATQWQRLVGPTADPLPAQVARLQPATDGAWRKALLGMRARGDLVEEGTVPQATWALGSGAGQIETAGWPEGRAGWVVAYLRARGAEAILPLLEPLTVEFVHARAA